MQATKQRQRWSAAAAVVCGGTLILLLVWLLRREQEIQPAPPNPFVRELEFVRSDDARPVQDSLELNAGTGFYARLLLTPAHIIPESFEGFPVQEAGNWPLSLVIYPRGSSADREDAVALPVRTYARSNVLRGRPSAMLRAAAIQSRPIFVGDASRWIPAVGFTGPLSPEENDRREGVRRWTYFVVPQADTGEYVYELHLYPTAAWTSAVRRRIGSSVVLKRGLVRVVDANA